MANLLTTLLRRRAEPEITRYTLSDYIQARVNAIQSLAFPGFASTGTVGGRPVEQIENSYTGYAAGAYKTNTVVASCMRVRRDLFSQAAFCWREITDNGPGRTFRDESLAVLERPWPNGTTGELLTRMITDVDLCGNSYIVNEGERLRWLRPDWVSIVLSGDPQLEAGVDVVGYVYAPGGQDLEHGVVYQPDEVCHWCVDEETEILTADGWKTYTTLRPGDETLTLNHETGLAEWQPVLDVCVFPAQRREMVLMEGSEFSSLTTPNHRWPVEYRISRRGTYGRRWVTTATIGAGDRIPTAAYGADLPTEPKWSDALVEVVAWFWTEGKLNNGSRPGRKGRGLLIAQSVKNADNLARIRAALTTLFGPAVPRIPIRGRRIDIKPCWRESRDDDIMLFRLSSNAGDVITQHAPGKIVTTAFLRSLTAAQLDLFIKVSMLADNNGPTRLAQKSPAMAEQFALACILAGHSVSIRPGSSNWCGYRMTNVRMLSKRHVYPQEATTRQSAFAIKRVAYDGHVWCPRTANETWLARRKGSVYFTGNSPIPDPLALYRGQTWLTPAIRDIQADTAATEHKLAFFNNGATLGPIIRVPAGVTREQFKEFIAESDAAHVGSANAYRPFYIGGGVDVTLAGASMQQLEFRATQGAGETRVAALAGVHPVLVGLSEGLAGSSLNAGNFSSARRATTDITLWKLWIDVLRALSTFVTVPADAQLWIDERQVPFLREDARDRAEITKSQILALESGIRAGYKPDPLVVAVDTDDITVLTGAHSNLYSVQLQPAGGNQQQPTVPPELDLTRPETIRAYIARHAIAATEYEDDDQWYPAEVLNGKHHRFDDDELERAGFRTDQARFGKGVHIGLIPVAGRWRKLTGGLAGVRKILEALDVYARGEGSDEPLAGFTVPKLRKAARAMGLSHHGGRGELEGRIKDDVRKKVIGHRQRLRDLPQYSYGTGVDRPQARDRDGKLRDVAITQTPQGLVVQLLDENNRGMYNVVAVPDWLALYKWARKKKLKNLAGWVDKYHPVTNLGPRRRKLRNQRLLSTLRGYSTYAEAEYLLHGLEPAEVQDLYRHLGGDLNVLPKAPNGRIPNKAVIDAILRPGDFERGWPRFRAIGAIGPGGNPLAEAAHGPDDEIDDLVEGSVYGAPSDFGAPDWGGAGFSAGLPDEIETPFALPVGPMGTAGSGRRARTSVRAVLADAETIDEVNAAVGAEVRRITGRDLYGDVDMAGSDLQIARLHGEGILQGLERFPGVSLMAVGTYGPGGTATQASRDLLREQPNAYAATHRGNGIYFNNLYAADPELYWTTSSRWMSVAERAGPRGVALHEFGHAVVESGSTSRTYRRAYDQAVEMAQAAGVEPRVFIARHLSPYAASDEHEFAAEAFADVMINGPAATELSKRVFVIIEGDYQQYLRTRPMPTW